MMIDTRLLRLHRRALDEAGEVVADVALDDLSRSTPCAGWDLRALIEHMIGQNHGFAAAVEEAGRGDVGAEAFAPHPLPGGGRAPVAEPWAASAARVTDAFAGADGDAEVLLAEIDTVRRIPVATVLGMHLLDTVVHGWDVAQALGRGYRPSDDLVAAVASGAARAPDGAAREAAGAAFGPVRTRPPDEDPWRAALALLGRGD